MADLKKSACKSFSFEDDLCKFLRSGQVEDVISINQIGSGFILFYTKVELIRPSLRDKKQSKELSND